MGVARVHACLLWGYTSRGRCGLRATPARAPFDGVLRAASPPLLAADSSGCCAPRHPRFGSGSFARRDNTSALGLRFEVGVAACCPLGQGSRIFSGAWRGGPWTWRVGAGPNRGASRDAGIGRGVISRGPGRTVGSTHFRRPVGGIMARLGRSNRRRWPADSGRRSGKIQWWVGPLATGLGFAAFIIYSTFRAFYNGDYELGMGAATGPERFSRAIPT